MKKTIILLFVLLLYPIVSCAAEAVLVKEEEVVLVRKVCYSSISKVYCTGSVQNTTDRDINNVTIHFSSSYLKLHAPQVNTDIYDEVEYIPANETYQFKVVWDAKKLAKDIDPDILREYILTSIENQTMEVNIFRQMTAPPPPSPAAATPAPLDKTK